jgi:RimJ/RimL family protein N-acetyltransferase
LEALSVPWVDPLPRVLDGAVLRRLAPDDLGAFQAYRNDPEVARYQGWLPMPDDQASCFLVAMRDAPLFRRGEWTQIGIASTPDGHLVGDIGVLLAGDGRQAEIGFALSRACQRRGIATRAVDGTIALILELTAARRILAITDARNVPSVRLLERVGMCMRELRNTVWRGEACEELVFVLSREDRGRPPTDAPFGEAP